jgi:hypothetical protein
MRKPEPAFRAIRDAEAVARIVADAAEAHLARPQVTRAPAPALHPVAHPVAAE